MGDLVEVEAEVRLGVKRQSCNSQESCCVKKRNLEGSVVKAVGSAAELVGNMAVMSPGAVGVADMRIDE